MGLYRNLVDRLVIRLNRDEYNSVPLRDYFRKTYGIEIGLYTFGAFDRWRVPPGTRIGRYCSIARNARFIDANHPMDTLSTHPYFYEARFGVIPADRLTLRPQIVEDDVWIGHNATIGAGCHVIGRGAVIGANAVVTKDVPPYAVVTGIPAKVARTRFDPETIALVEESRWWLLDRQQLAKAVAQAPDFAHRPNPETAAAFVAAVRAQQG